MAITHSTALRAVLAEAVNTYVDTGGGTAVLRLFDSGNIGLIDFPLLNPAYTPNGAGAITLNGTPISAVANASGTIASFAVLAADGTTAYAGSVSLTNGGGDLQVTSTDMQQGKSYTLTEHSYSAPA